MGEILKVFSGSFNLLDWVRSERPAVEPGVSAARAARCLGCTKNGDGPLTQWFTEPASERIKEEIEKRADFHLLTPYDACLGVCTACFCPLKTKVHEPIDLVLKHLKPEVEKELWEGCWILHEKPPEPPEALTTHDKKSDSHPPQRRLRRSFLSRSFQKIFGNRRS